MAEDKTLSILEGLWMAGQLVSAATEWMAKAARGEATKEEADAGFAAQAREIAKEGSRFLDLAG